MISLAKVFSGKPMRIIKDIYFYQPTLQEIVDMGEETYWFSLNIWLLKRKDMVAEENEITMAMSDFELWKECVFSSPHLKQNLMISCSILLHQKIEFFEISNTIYIGEKGLGIILDDSFYLFIRELCQKLISYVSASDKKDEQYKEVEGMSERERQMIEKMKASEAKLEIAKNKDSNPEDSFGRRILGLVAIGHYTVEQVYNMTMLQFNLLLQKYVDIQSFELRSALAPYISSEDGQTNEFWLN